MSACVDLSQVFEEQTDLLLFTFRCLSWIDSKFWPDTCLDSKPRLYG